MLSKKLKIFFLFFVSGCGLNVGESSKPTPVVQTQSSGCLDQSLDDFKLMFNGQLADGKVAPAVNCVTTTIREFTDNVQGENKNYFTATELTSFINKKVYTGTKPLPPTLLEELMKLKVTLLGGEASTFSKAELRQLCHHLETLTPDLISINRYLRYSQNDQLKTDYALFNQTEKDFTLALDHLAQLIRQGYDLKNLKSLFTAFHQADLFLSLDFDKYYDILLSGHQLITSIERTAITAAEIKNIFSVLSRGYFNVLEYQNYLQPLDYENPLFAERAGLLLPKAQTTLNQALAINSKGFMSTENFLKMYEVTYRQLNKKPPLTMTSVEIVLKTLWSNLLNSPTERLAGHSLPGFNSEALTQLCFYLNSLFTSDQQVAPFFKASVLLTQPQLLELIKNQMLFTSDATIIHLLTEIQAVSTSPIPLTLNQNFMKILDPSTAFYSYHDLQISNIARIAARLVTAAYATSLNRIKDLEKLSSQLSLPEMQTAFNQIKNVLVELDFLTPNSDNFMTSRFRDANLFVPRANGDEWLNFFETHDLAIHLISGCFRAQKIRPYIAKECLPLLITPLKSAIEVDEACILDVYYRHDQGFEFLPQFTRLKSSIDVQKNKEYYLNLLISGGYIMDVRHKVLMEDADRFPHVVQYLEMTFAMFDTNRDGIIVKDEAMRAFPLYKPIIKKALASMDGGSSVNEDEIPGVFIYFLKYGRAPSGIIEKIQFKLFIGNEKKWIINSTRYDLGLLFKALASY